MIPVRAHPTLPIFFNPEMPAGVIWEDPIAKRFLVKDQENFERLVDEEFLRQVGIAPATLSQP